jgi:hypothetical protein
VPYGVGVHIRGMFPADTESLELQELVTAGGWRGQQTGGRSGHAFFCWRVVVLGEKGGRTGRDIRGGIYPLAPLNENGEECTTSRVDGDDEVGTNPAARNGCWEVLPPFK